MSTTDVIAILAVLAAFGAAIAALLQWRAAARIAEGQFLLDMDQAFEADREIRDELASPDASHLSPRDWRLAKAYMGRVQRVGVFVSEGLLDAEVVYRLYGARLYGNVRQPAIRKRLLEDPDRARNWIDFLELWRVGGGDKPPFRSAGGSATA